jgi:hypothetical protein
MPQPPKSGAERQRECRARQEAGLAIYALALPKDAVAEFLIEGKLLTEDETADHDRCRQTLADWVGRKIAERLKS